MTTKDAIALIAKMLKPLNIRCLNLVRLGKVLLVKAGRTQSLQVQTAGREVVENAKFIEPYGLTSNPLSGSECIVLNIQGNPGNPVVINVGSRQFRVQGLKPGEVCLYDNSGSFIHLKNGGNIEVYCENELSGNCKSLKLTAQTATITAQTVNLGGEGGQPAAFVGCEVVVDPNTHKGTITSGSTVVRVKQ